MKQIKVLGPGCPNCQKLASLVEEVLTPLDPAVFRRQLQYFTELQSAEAARETSQQDAKD